MGRIGHINSADYHKPVPRIYGTMEHGTPRMEAGGVSHLVQCLDLVDCIRLACCSKAAHAALQEQLAAGSKPVARQMLVEYVKQAGNCTPQSTSSADRSQLGLYAHEQQQVHWLVQQAGPMHEILRCGSHIAECMSIDKVPAAVAIALVHSGLRFTYEQLMSAVQQHVRGAEVWVQAYRQLGIQRPCGMPYIAEVLCCSDKVLPATALRHLSAQNLLEVMQLAVVMPAVGTATSLLEDICASGAADHLAEDAVYDLIAAAIKAGHSPRVELLLRLPTARRMKQYQALHLLQAAISAKLTYSLQLLCKVPAAYSLDTEQLMGLLQTAVEVGEPGAVRVMCGLPAAEQLGAGVVQYLLQVVLGVSRPEQGTSCGMVWALSQLPAALNDHGMVGAF